MDALDQNQLQDIPAADLALLRQLSGLFAYSNRSVAASEVPLIAGIARTALEVLKLAAEAGWVLQCSGGGKGTARHLAYLYMTE